MEEITNPVTVREIPERARIVSKTALFPGTDIWLLVMCLGNGLHAEYDDYAAAVFESRSDNDFATAWFKFRGIEPADNVKITPCDCESRHIVDVPEIVKARLRKLGNESTR